MLEALLLDVDRKRLPDTAPVREIAAQCCGCVIWAAAHQFCLRRQISGGAVDDVNDTYKTGCTVHDGCRAAQHLDAFNVLQIESCYRRVECAAVRHAINY